MRNRRFVPTMACLPFRIMPSSVSALTTLASGSTGSSGSTTDPSGSGTFIPGCGGSSSSNSQASGNSNTITPGTPTG